MKQRWYRGHIGRFWSPDDYKNFEYTRQPITESEITEWKNKGYDHVKSFSGMMYDNRNPMPEWTNRFKSIFDYTNLTFTFYKMSTLEIMPEHVDHFNTYKKIHNTNYENIVRILVMLDDWKPGHYLEIDGMGIVNWIAGDYFVWDSDVPHAASNIGIEDRYSLQITGQKIQNEDVWQKLHWYNIPELETKRESVVDPYMATMLKSVLNNKTTPLYIYMYNEKIKELDSINHSDNTIDYLNKHGIDFYLFEPLCSYIEGNTKHNRIFYSEFYGDEDINSLRANELDSIREYVLRNRLTNVNVRTCDYDVGKYYPYYNDCMRLLTDDLFVKTCPPIVPTDASPDNTFVKKFICANWRYTPHRHLIAAAVAPLSGYCSWYYKSDLYHIYSDAWYNLDNWKKDNMSDFDRILVGLAHLNRHAPINIDMKITEPITLQRGNSSTYFPSDTLPNHILNSGRDSTNLLEPFYKDVFCDVVTETRFAQPTANYSEKVYQPMFYKKPFILVAPPHTLKYMREAGFKTFSNFWNEDYDECEIHEERLLKIFKLIDYINTKSISELRIMYDQMLPTLIHNSNLVKELSLKVAK